MSKWRQAPIKTQPVLKPRLLSWLQQEQLALDFQCRISGSGWRGSAVVPQSYLPPAVTRFNAFAIHGEGEKRVYEALYPARKHHDQPDL